MKILFLANLIPHPLDGGGKIFTFSVLKSLSEKHDIDLLCFYEHENILEGKEKLKKYCNSIDVLPIRVTTKENMGLMMIKAGLSIFSDKPLGVNKYIIGDMKNKIREKITNTKYDCVVFNLLAMYGYAGYIKKLNPNVITILYEQNCEALIYKRYLSETNNVLKKLFLKFEIFKLEKFEQESINNVDKLILLSEEDRKALNVSSNRCSIIPIGVQPSNYKKLYDNEVKHVIRMLFVGTMTWAPNNEGIIWFLKNVMPMCADGNKYELYIIGKNPSIEVQELSKKYSNVLLLGYVDSLDEYYKQCDILVVPLFIGSGQRVKIIESFAKGYCVISTSIGAEGLNYVDGENLLIANNAVDFKRQIDRCVDHSLLNKIGNSALTLYEKNYSTTAITKLIDAVLEK